MPGAKHCRRPFMFRGRSAKERRAFVGAASAAKLASLAARICLAIQVFPALRFTPLPQGPKNPVGTAAEALSGRHLPSMARHYPMPGCLPLWERLARQSPESLRSRAFLQFRPIELRGLHSSHKDQRLCASRRRSVVGQASAEHGSALPNSGPLVFVGAASAAKLTIVAIADRFANSTNPASRFTPLPHRSKTVWARAPKLYRAGRCRAWLGTTVWDQAMVSAPPM